jgi:hypothetical protein
VDERFRGAGKSLVILTQTPFAIQPSERTLDDPSAREHLERVRPRRRHHDLYIDTQVITSVSNESTRVGSISPYFSHRRIGAMHGRQHDPSTISILNVCGKHKDHENQPEHVDEDVPLSAVDLLAGILAARSAHLRCFYGLAVKNCSCRIFVSPLSLPNMTAKHIVDSLPRSVLLPLAKVAVDQLPLRKVVRQHAPLTTRSI